MKSLRPLHIFTHDEKDQDHQQHQFHHTSPTNLSVIAQTPTTADLPKVMSEETLVSPISESQKMVLKFYHDNPLNTSISGPDDALLYRVTTTFGNETKALSMETGTVTTVEKFDGEIVARLIWTELGYDKLAVGEEKAVRLGKVLHTSPFFSETVSFKDDKGRRYEWRGNRPGLLLRLYAPDYSMKPIAYFSRSRSEQVAGGPKLASLTVLPRGQEILDLVVWSFCFLEKGRRAAENKYGNIGKAGGLMSPF
ncbi:hypothetical protein FRC17_010059 [Serendipita sp. 399]|nr:hypothetical protein FRC17_010059 [Serendipita sp. 399]